jgi:Acyl-CoA dehydrogenase, N-terminal domain
MAVDRLLPTDEGAELVSLVREIAQAELASRAAADEAAEGFPRDAFVLLGEAGLLGLPYPEEYGGAGQPYEVYLQALEEVAMAWMTVGLGVSVHVMASYPMAAFGTPEQRTKYLPEMIGGQFLGAYALSEAQAGSDISGMTTRAKHADHGYELNGVDYPRLVRRFLHDLCAHQRRSSWGGELLPCARTGARTHLWEARAQDGPERIANDFAVLRRRCHRRRSADRGGRPGCSDCLVGIGFRATRYRGVCDGARASCP